MKSVGEHCTGVVITPDEWKEHSDLIDRVMNIVSRVYLGQLSELKDMKYADQERWCSDVGKNILNGEDNKEDFKLAIHAMAQFKILDSLFENGLGEFGTVPSVNGMRMILKEHYIKKVTK